MSTINEMFANGMEVIKNESVEKRVLWFLIEFHERILETAGVSASNNLDSVSDVTTVIFNINKFEQQDTIKELELELDEKVDIRGATTEVTYEDVKKIYISTKLKYRIYSESTAVNSFLMLFHIFRLRFDELAQSRVSFKALIEDWGLCEDYYPLLMGFSFSADVKKLCKEYLGPLTVAVCLANSSEEESSFWFKAFRQAYYLMPGATLMASSIAEGEDKGEMIKVLASLGDFGESSYKLGIPMSLVLTVCRQSRQYLSWLGGGMQTSLDCYKVPAEVQNLNVSGGGVHELWTAASALSQYQITVPKGTTRKIATELVHHASLGPHQSPYCSQSLPFNLQFSSKELIEFTLLEGSSLTLDQAPSLEQPETDTDIYNECIEPQPEDYDEEIFQMDDI